MKEGRNLFDLIVVGPQVVSNRGLRLLNAAPLGPPIEPLLNLSLPPPRPKNWRQTKQNACTICIRVRDTIVHAAAAASVCDRDTEALCLVRMNINL